MTLQSIAKQLAKTKPAKTYPLLFDAFVIIAASGEVDAATEIVRWMYDGRLPLPMSSPTAFSTSAIDGFCFAAGTGDQTAGHPAQRADETGERPFEERVLASERLLRSRLVADAYQNGPSVDEHWLSLEEPWRTNNRWRWIQRLAAPAHDGSLSPTERQALGALESYIEDWDRRARGPGYGVELVLALDLALRHGCAHLVPSWLEAQGHRFESEPFLLQQSLCLPAVATAVVRGAFREVVSLDAPTVGKLLGAISVALAGVTSAPNSPLRRAPVVQRRRVSCEYSQFYIEPEVLDGADERAYFQDKRESPQGMSIFPTRVAVATPSETAYVDVEIVLAQESSATLDLSGVVQAVAFPLSVGGPLRLRSVDDDDDGEPVVVPVGQHDVLTCFYSKTAPRAEAKAGLRVFRVVMSFFAEGTLAAPKCLRLDDTEQPPSTVFVNR